VFNKVNANALRMKEVREMTNYPLRLTDFQAFKAARDAEADNYKNLFDAVVNPSVKNLPVDLPAIENDESKVARNTDFLETVSKDVYIREVMSIIHDIIEQERIVARN
jgi:carboxyl-terminal processing protease